MNTVVETEELAEKFLGLEFFKIDPENLWELTSGIMSPFFFDASKVFGNVPIRTKVIRALEEKVQQIISENGNFTIFCGVESGGVPYASVLADRFCMPLIRVRKERKDHGLCNLIEGMEIKEISKKPIVIFKDVISTGGSVFHAARVVREAGGKVVACVAILDHDFEVAKRVFEREGIKIFSLVNTTDILTIARSRGFRREKGGISSEDYDRFRGLQCCRCPKEWGKHQGTQYSFPL